MAKYVPLAFDPATGRATAAPSRAAAKSGRFEGVDITVKELEALSAHLREGLREQIRISTVRLRLSAFARAPVKTGRLALAIKHVYFDDGNVGSVYVAPMAEPRRARYFNLQTKQYIGAQRSRKFPLWLEYGTTRTAARPYLIPAFEAEKPRFEAGCRRVLASAPTG